jgi:NADH dehydrogenase (ubiquinone) Fe-S protein 6
MIELAFEQHILLTITTTMSLLRSQLLRTALRPRAVTQAAWSRAKSSTVPEPQNPLQPFQPDESTPKASQQSPNVPTTWSTSQNPKPHVQNNARYVLPRSERLKS